MTPMTPKQTRLERAIAFLEVLEQQTQKDTGTKAILKRGLSGNPRHMRLTYPFVLPYLDGIPERQQDIWIFVGCLATYHDQETKPADQNFARSCFAFSRSSTSEGTKRRFRALLDTALADIQSPITALVRQFKSQKDKKVTVYYPRLIVDLCNWEHPDQFVQDCWARTFWQAPINDAPTSGATEN
jgi:CRISPR system Cascade subunit CasB